MPPRSAKKAAGSAGAAKKTVARTARGAAKAAQNTQEVKVEETVKVEEPAKAEVKTETKVEEVVVVKDEVKVEAKTVVPEPEPESRVNGSVPPPEEEEDVKVTYDEEDKGECLELDDNDAEYEPEEDQGVDYEGKDVENDDAQEEGDEYEEIEERDESEDDASNMIQEMENDGEDVEGEEEDENVEEEHEVDGDEEEHHDIVQERRKRKEFEVFVGGLDKDATETDLRKVFGEVGEITEVRLMMNPQTKKNKGFAFLRFATVEQAKRAVSELKNPVVNGKQCGVSPSQDSDTLFLGNINKSWTKDELKEKLKHYGIENVEDMTLVEDTNNKGMNRGFAFLEFSSRSDAMDAYRRLQRRDVVFGVDRTAKVAFADTFIEPDDEIMAQVKTVFVDGLPAAWDEDRVKAYLKKFGVIEKIELARNMPSAKRKDFGFVTFDTHEAAVACAEGINNAELGEGDNKVKVRARLSRPHQRGRGKGARGDFRVGRVAPRGGRPSWASRPPPRRLPTGPIRPLGIRGAPIGARGFKRPIGVRDRYPVMAAAERVRHLPPPERSYVRRPPVASYPRSSSKWDYSRRNEIPSRSRAPVDYDSRVPAERRPSYRDEYASRGSGYSDVAPRTVSRAAPRRGYADEAYSGRRLERPPPPPPAYRESRGRDYDPLPGSKRPYSSLDDAPSRYADVSVRQSRARMDYGIGGSSQYADAYGERTGRSHLGYGGTRSSLSGQDSHDFYSSRQGMDYGAGSMRSSDVGGMYSSSFGSGYLSRGSDVGGSSYSSLYSSRNLNANSYIGGSGSGSYY